MKFSKQFLTFLMLYICIALANSNNALANQIDRETAFSIAMNYLSSFYNIPIVCDIDSNYVVVNQPDDTMNWSVGCMINSFSPSSPVVTCYATINHESGAVESFVFTDRDTKVNYRNVDATLFDMANKNYSNMIDFATDYCNTNCLEFDLKSCSFAKCWFPDCSEYCWALRYENQPSQTLTLLIEADLQNIHFAKVYFIDKINLFSDEYDGNCIVTHAVSGNQCDIEVTTDKSSIQVIGYVKQDGIVMLPIIPILREIGTQINAKDTAAWNVPSTYYAKCIWREKEFAILTNNMGSGIKDLNQKTTIGGTRPLWCEYDGKNLYFDIEFITKFMDEYLELNITII